MSASQLALDFDAYVVRERLSRKARSVRIEVRPGGDVLLVIPRWATRAEAHAFLRDREAWVRQKIAEWRLRAPASALPRQELRWDGSDRVPLRGEAVPLRLVPADIAHPRIRLDEGITVFAARAIAADRPRLERYLRKALMEEARRTAMRLLDAEAQRLDFHYTGLRIGDPGSQWGSCGSNGRISLSWRLLLAPIEVFRYVVIHELCHLRWRGHGPRFWGLVERQMPDFDAQRRWLRSNGGALHAVLPRSQDKPRS